MSTDRRTRAWIEVNAASIRRNLSTVRERVGDGVGLIPMVKADGYGLGMAQTVAATRPLAPWGYGVATVDEGIQLRELREDLEILVCSPIPPGSYGAAVEAGLTLAVSDLDALGRLDRAAEREGREVAFHLEVDTGIGRAGFDWRQASRWVPEVNRAQGPRLRWEGCLTHFHSADVESSGASLTQWQRFRDTLGAMPEAPRNLMVHACNSAAALRTPEFAADAVRPGIFLYGGSAGKGIPRPEHVASLRARVNFVREASPGSTVGYGATHVAQEWERWAALGIGYGDGLPRSLGNRGEVVIRGQRAPMVGRISMDVTVVDITRVPDVQLGDVATLLGRDGEEEITVDAMADLAGTISYEILTGLTRRLPRVWLDDGS